MNCSSVVSGAGLISNFASSALTRRSISPGSSLAVENVSQAFVSKLATGNWAAFLGADFCGGSAYMVAVRNISALAPNATFFQPQLRMIRLLLLWSDREDRRERIATECNDGL